MANIINWVKMVFGAITGLFSWIYGGLDMLLSVLLVCIVLDYISGLLAALYTQTLNSQTGYKGILKKVIILAIVTLGSVIGLALGQPAIRDIVIGFYIANEGISILENAGRMDVPVCSALSKFLEQLKNKDNSDKQ